MADRETSNPRRAALTALGWQRGELAVGGIAARELVERFGSPLYAFDAEVVRAQSAALRRAFGPEVGVLFALKANPNAALAAVARRAGCGIEVASAGEILVARHAGFAGVAIHFAGPGKSDVDLHAALDAGVDCLNLESELEYRRIADLARARGVTPGVAIRVNTGRAQQGARLRMARASSRFGVDAEQVAALARRIAADGACRLRGLHAHGASQSFDAAEWLASARALCALADELDRELATPCASLGFGGGFGWPLHDGDGCFDLAAAGAGLRACTGDGPRRAFVEPGRWLVAPAGVYLCTVRDVKVSGGRRHAIVDGGMHHHAAAAGFGAPARRAWPIVAAHDPLPEHAARVTLGGPLCTPADRFGQELALAELAPGDVVAVLASGAYGLTYSSTMFLGHPTPAEVLVDGGRARVCRERGRPEDALRGQPTPDAD